MLQIRNKFDRQCYKNLFIEESDSLISFAGHKAAVALLFRETRANRFEIVESWVWFDLSALFPSVKNRFSGLLRDGYQSFYWVVFALDHDVHMRHRINNSGTDPASTVRGGGILSLIWVHTVCILHNTAVTKQWMAKWPCIANDVFRKKLMVNRVTFVGFVGGNPLPPDPPLCALHQKGCVHINAQLFPLGDKNVYCAVCICPMPRAGWRQLCSVCCRSKAKHFGDIFLSTERN